MAKAKIKNLDEAINKKFKRYESNLKKAMKYAADEAEFSIVNEAETCLYQYYENHDPKWYNRTEQLIQAFVPVNEVFEDKNNIVARAGVIYDPSKLEGAYYSSASDKAFFNPVDATWILQNYLAGIHPSTNGYPIYADEPVYIEIKDSVSPDAKMKKYIEEYKETFDQNVLKWFARRVTRR